MRPARAFLVGVGAAYFFDPRLGRRRRAVARDRSAKLVRSTARRTRKKARFAEGKAYGVYARARRAVFGRDVDSGDAVVEQRIRSEALRNVGVAANDIEVGVADGIATITGEVAGDKVASSLVEHVQKVPGVEDVAAMLRVVGDETGDE